MGTGVNDWNFQGPSRVMSVRVGRLLYEALNKHLITEWMRETTDWKDTHVVKYHYLLWLEGVAEIGWFPLKDSQKL